MVSPWRKALGVVKDQTSIGLAKVATSRIPELDIAIVKATSHDDMAADEKYIREVLHFSGISFGYAKACLQAITKRINKTHNWVVAIKALVLTHRLLCDRNSAFEEELRTLGLRNILNLTCFRDDSHANAWDYSAFVRNYATYLDARLDCNDLLASKSRQERSDLCHNLNGYDDITKSSFKDKRYRLNARSHSSDKSRQKELLEMDWEVITRTLSDLQHMLERVLACRPTGAAKNHRLVQISLFLIVKESFQIYADLREGIRALVKVYSDMQLEAGTKLFHIYARYAKLSEALSSFYNMSKGMSIFVPSRYPQVEKVSPDDLKNLENFLTKQSRFALSQRPPLLYDSSNRLKSVSTSLEIEKEQVKHVSRSVTQPLPNLPIKVTSESIQNHQNKNQTSNDNRKQRQREPSLPELAYNKTKNCDEAVDVLLSNLFPGSCEVNTDKLDWATFDNIQSNEESLQKSKNISTIVKIPLHAPTTQTKNIDVKNWELALVHGESNISKRTVSSKVGNIDRFLFDSMYDARQQMSSPVPSSAGSFALQNLPRSGTLALPAPQSSTLVATHMDPFAASAAIPPPTYVQVADLQQKQRFMQEQQQLWQQSQAYNHHTLMRFYAHPFATNLAMTTFSDAPYYRG